MTITVLKKDRCKLRGTKVDGRIGKRWVGASVHVDIMRVRMTVVVLLEIRGMHISRKTVVEGNWGTMNMRKDAVGVKRSIVNTTSTTTERNVAMATDKARESSRTCMKLDQLRGRPKEMATE